MQPAVTTGLDIAKSVFQIHGVDAIGDVVVRQRLSRPGEGPPILCQDPRHASSDWKPVERRTTRTVASCWSRNWEENRADRGNGSASADQRTRDRGRPAPHGSAGRGASAGKRDRRSGS